MKTFILATAIALSTGAGYAGELGLNGSIEYQVEAEKFEATISKDFAMGAVTLSPELTAYYTEADDISFDGLDMTASYAVVESLSVYATLETNADFEYDEVSVGVSLSF